MGARAAGFGLWATGAPFISMVCAAASCAKIATTDAAMAQIGQNFCR